MSGIANYFVGIGAQKSGTTWLARMLADHPDVFVTPVKEIHYFDHIRGLTEQLSPRKRRSRYRKYHQRMWTQWHRLRQYRSQWSWWRDYMRRDLDDAWYCRLFEHRGGRTMAGEITPEYAIIGKEGLAHIHKLAPTARVIFIMRNPVDRLWSQVLHQCRARRLDVASQSTDAIIAMLSEPRFGELADYAATLDDMTAVFGAEQCLALFYEDMHQDRLAALAQVCAFLGVRFEAQYFPELGRRYNRSQQAVLPPAVREHLRNHCRQQAEAVRARLGRLPDAWSREFDLGPARTG
ncbi:MAG: sulfotransferase [Hyphomicrobiaceae bacterium]